MTPTYSRWSGLLGLLAATAGGCATNTGDPFLNQAASPAVAPKVDSRPAAMVVLKPVIGPPDAVSKSFVQQLNAAALKKDVALLVDADAKAPLTLHSYLLVERSGSNVKVLYVWDITDEAGQRLRRVEGEEVVPSTGGADAWSSVSPAVTGPMAEKAMEALVPIVRR